MQRVPPPWIKTAASRNIAKRARARNIMKRKGIAPLTKAQARALLDQVNSGPGPPTRE